MKYLSLLLILITVANAESFFNVKDFLTIKDVAGNLPAILKDNANIRENSEIKSKKIGLLAGGSVIHANFKDNDEWVSLQYNGKKAYTIKSNLIKQRYYADILYDGHPSNISFISMSGQNESKMSGSYNITYQHAKNGIASYMIKDSSYEEPLFLKLKNTNTNAYMSITHQSSNRLIYIITLFVVDNTKMTIIKIPSFTTNSSNKFSVENNILKIYLKNYFSCCDYYQYSISINLSTLTYTAIWSDIAVDDVSEKVNDKKEINLDLITKILKI